MLFALMVTFSILSSYIKG